MGVRGAEEEEGRAELVTADTEGAKVGGKGAKNVGKHPKFHFHLSPTPLFAKKRGEVRVGLFQNSLPPSNASLPHARLKCRKERRNAFFLRFPLLFLPD